MRTSTPGSPRRGVRRTVWIAAVLTTAIALSASPALADPPIGANSGGGTGTTPTEPTPPSGGTGGGAPTYTYYTYTSPAEYSIGLCPATDSRGEALLGRHVRFRGPGTLTVAELKAITLTGDSQGNNNWAASGVEQLSSVCLFPPAFEVRTVQAVISSTATVEMVQPRTETLGTGSDTSAWGRGDHSMSALTSSKTFAAVSATPEALGRYQAHAITRVQSVGVKHYLGVDPITGVKPADEIVSIGAPWDAYPASARGEMTCTGWHDGWTSSGDWSETPCDGSTSENPVTYQCTAPVVPAMNGVSMAYKKPNELLTGQATVFRDGAANTLDWTMPTFTSPDLVSIDYTASRVVRSGTPDGDAEVKVGLRGGDDRLTGDKTSTEWVEGSVGSWDARFRWASAAGAPTILTPQVKWQATLMKRSVEIVGVDSDGSWVTHEVTVPVHTAVTCDAYAVKIIVSRSVNS